MLRIAERLSRCPGGRVAHNAFAVSGHSMRDSLFIDHRAPSVDWSGVLPEQRGQMHNEYACPSVGGLAGFAARLSGRGYGRR